MKENEIFFKKFLWEKDAAVFLMKVILIFFINILLANVQKAAINRTINKCLKRKTFVAKISLKFPLTIKNIFSRLVFYIQLNTKIEGGKKNLLPRKRATFNNIIKN